MAFNEILLPQDDGTLKANAERQEQIQEAISEMFRFHREMRRRGRMVDRIAAQISDEKIKKSLGTWGGKFLMIELVRKSVQVDAGKALSDWRSDHFEKTANGFKFKADQEGFVTDFRKSVDAIRKELKNDDF